MASLITGTGFFLRGPWGAGQVAALTQVIVSCVPGPSIWKKLIMAFKRRAKKQWPQTGILTFDAHRRFDFFPQEAPADFNEAVGCVGDEKTMSGFAVLFGQRALF